MKWSIHRGVVLEVAPHLEQSGTFINWLAEKRKNLSLLS